MPFLAALGPIMGGAPGALGMGLDLLGGFMGNREREAQLQQAIQAAGFQGTNIGGALGNVGFNADTGAFDLQLTPEQQALQQALQGSALSQLGAASPFMAEAMGSVGPGQLMQGQQGLMAALGQDPSAAFGQHAGLLQGLTGATTGAGLGSMLAGLGQLDPTQSTQAGLGFLGQAQGLLGQAGDVSGLVSDRLGALREAAAPQEERQYNSLQQRLFSQGRLGSTGGSRDIEAFARGLGQADLSRQVEAQNLGLQTQQNLAQQAGMFGQLGQGFLGQGLTAAGQRAQLGSNILGQGAGFSEGLLGTQLGLQDLGISRAGQRISAMQQMLGFGQGFQGAALQNALSGVQGISGIQSPLLQLLGQSANLSGIRTQAGANQAELMGQSGGSGIGGLLSGIGGMFG